MLPSLACRSAIAAALLIGFAGNGMAQDPKDRYGLAGLQMTSADQADFKQFLHTPCTTIAANAKNKTGDFAIFTKFAKLAFMQMDLAFSVEARHSPYGDTTPLVDRMSNKAWLGLPDKVVMYCSAIQSPTVLDAVTAVYKDARTTVAPK